MNVKMLAKIFQLDVITYPNDISLIQYVNDILYYRVIIII